MNLKMLSAETLLQNTKDLASRERELTTQVLWHLREIEARRLFASLGYSSLFEYTVKELGYSEASAMRRVNAMRLLKELPQVEASLKEGKLNLSHLSSVQSFFQSQKKHEEKTYTKEEKLELLDSLRGTSQRQTEKVLATLAPQTVAQNREKVRPITETHCEFKTVISQELLIKLERVKGLCAHRLKTGSWAELLELLVDQSVQALDPACAKPKKQRTAPPAPKSSRSRFIPRALKQVIFSRANGQCEFCDPRTGKRCSARSFLQIDHIVPYALGGSTRLENLRLLCHAHNQWAALQNFGSQKMQSYWKNKTS